MIGDLLRLDLDVGDSADTAVYCRKVRIPRRVKKWLVSEGTRRERLVRRWLLTHEVVWLGPGEWRRVGLTRGR